MNLSSDIFVIDGLCSILFLIIFFISYKFPPKKINTFYGYRTSRSMKSQERWNFAQGFCSIQFLKSTVVLLLVSIIGLYTSFSPALDTTMAFVFLGLAIVYPVYKTEKALKEIEQHEKDNQD
jgi:uncharacterized membrane protein